MSRSSPFRPPFRAIDWCMDARKATVEEFAAEGYTHLEYFRPRCRVTGLRPIQWLPKISMGLTLAQLSVRLRCVKCGGSLQSLRPWRMEDVLCDLSLSKTLSGEDWPGIGACSRAMIAILTLLIGYAIALSRAGSLKFGSLAICGEKAGRHLVNLEKPWRRIRAAAKLDNVSLHDLRHSFASVAASGGQSLVVIGKNAWSVPASDNGALRTSRRRSSESGERCSG